MSYRADKLVDGRTDGRTGATTITEGQNWPRVTTWMPAFWDTPSRPIITHTSDLHQIPSQNKTKSKLQILKKLTKIQTLKFCKELYTLYKMYKYEMDPTRTVGAIEQTRDTGWTDGETDGWSETNILHCTIIRSQFSPKSSQKAPHSLPIRASYEVYFVGPNSDLYSASVTTVMNAISHYIGPCYNGTQLCILQIPKPS